MKICLIGLNITNLILASVFSKKNLQVDIYQNNKIQRFKTLLMGNKESAVDEPLEDAYLDVSNYGIMATLVGRGKWGK